MRRITVGATVGMCHALTACSLRFVVTLSLLVLFLGMAAAANILDQPITLDIPSSTPLAEALTRWGTEAGVQVMMNSEDLADEKTDGVHGTQSAVRALAALLRNSRFTYTVQDNTIYVVRAALTKQAEGKHSGDSAKENQAGTEKPIGVDRQNHIEEILVTAQKRAERLQDVPVPVTAVGANALVENNQFRLQDYQGLLPGLNVTLNDFGAPELAIRGLTTGIYSNPTVATVIDDVPFGASTALVYGDQAPDFDPSDLARIEQLRGPQGTLYGASSLGGLIKYVTVEPSTEILSGRFSVGATTVRNGAQLGNDVRAAANVPINDTLAVRASAFLRLDPGYIDDLALHKEGVNRGGHSGVHLSTLWRSSEQFSVKLAAIFQKIRIDGSSLVDVGPGVGDLQQSDVRGTGWFDQKLRFYSATVKGKLGSADLVVIGGYGVNDWSDSLDYTSILGPSSLEKFGAPGAVFTNNDVRTDKCSQEIRLSMPIGRRFEWLVGAFYTHEDSDLNQAIFASSIATGVPAGTWLNANGPFTYSEYAGFTDLTAHITKRFDIQVGGRESRSYQKTHEEVVGPYNEVFLGLPSPYIYPVAQADGRSFTYLVTPRYRWSQDFMMYARIASGYRPGGPNLLPAQSLVPTSYKPDKTRNYELGMKRQFLDEKVSLDISLYRIDWKDIQLSFITENEYFTSNGGAAKSEGVEAALQARPSGGLRIGAWISWDNAVLTEALPPESATIGNAGVRLPATPRLSGSISLDEDVTLSASLVGFVGGDLQYVGRRFGPFTFGSAQREPLPPYGQVNVRTGLRYQSWLLSLSLSNAFDKRGVLDGGIATLNPAGYHYLRPRTGRLSVTRSF